jgi:hypothetical protein
MGAKYKNFEYHIKTRKTSKIICLGLRKRDKDFLELRTI